MENKLTYKNWDNQRQQELNEKLTDFMDVIKWAFKEYGENILYACSFGAEGMVLIDLITKVQPNAKVVFLDTDLHFKETYSLIEKVKQKYPKLQVKMVKPSLTLEQQTDQFGSKLWEYNPDLCCQMRKIEPLQQELDNVEAWISGLRREQSPSRKKTEYVNKDERFKRVKICPLIHWKWEDVWSYIKLNNLPYNELHDKNYPSIGCEKCTLPVKAETGSRSGRWANFDKKECGLHKA
ncbi:phosphoadenylyl-sulfate reductase [Sediminibacillus albus]|uniref:Adenosine 5'-phosphosulfate reductase n=1 Tax=Sediminibacillus albus TaxID=407036 RepID=A0A1G8X3L2_9BACI|nr:phosphoadenylyl-sulfate reductase [Sediminibacillus albus]SDJ84927.1 phosphoadenosine phosphosulfate reductase [Sediminibacillus albus]